MNTDLINALVKKLKGELVQTHASWVILTEDFAYKIYGLFYLVGKVFCQYYPAGVGLHQLTLQPFNKGIYQVCIHCGHLLPGLLRLVGVF